MTSVQPEYLDVIKAFFSCKINVGILGGRPGEAYFLIGVQDGFLIFLDPHNTEDAIPSDVNEIRKKHMSYHESNAKKIHYTKLDPSLGFAFLLRKHSDYLRLKDFMQMGKRQHSKNWIFHSMDTKPDYMKMDFSSTKTKKTKKAKKPKKPKLDDIDGFENLEESKDDLGFDDLSESKNDLSFDDLSDDLESP